MPNNMKEIYVSELKKGDLFYEVGSYGLNLYVFLDEVQVVEDGEIGTYNCFDMFEKAFNYFMYKEKVFVERWMTNGH